MIHNNDATTWQLSSRRTFPSNNSRRAVSEGKLRMNPHSRQMRSRYQRRAEWSEKTCRNLRMRSALLPRLIRPPSRRAGPRVKVPVWQRRVDIKLRGYRLIFGSAGSSAEERTACKPGVKNGRAVPSFFRYLRVSPYALKLVCVR